MVCKVHHIKLSLSGRPRATALTMTSQMIGIQSHHGICLARARTPQNKTKSRPSIIDSDDDEFENDENDEQVDKNDQMIKVIKIINIIRMRQKMTAVYLIQKQSFTQIQQDLFDMTMHDLPQQKQNMSDNVNLTSNNITMRAISITALIDVNNLGGNSNGIHSNGTPNNTGNNTNQNTGTSNSCSDTLSMSGNNKLAGSILNESEYDKNIDGNANNHDRNSDGSD